MTTFPAQVEQSPYLKKRWDCKQSLVMDWVHFLAHPLYDFEQVIWSLNALVPIHEKEVMMLSSLQLFFFFFILDWKKFCFFFLCFCVFCLFVFLEQLDSDTQQKFPSTAVNANNYLFSFGVCGHREQPINKGMTQILNWCCMDLR